MEKGLKKSQIIEFVGNLNRSNLDENIEIILKSVDAIMSVSDLSIAGIEKLTGIHHDTLRKILFKRKKGMFTTYNKLNNLIKRVIIADEKYDKSFGYTELPILSLDDNYSGDVN